MGGERNVSKQYKFFDHKNIHKYPQVGVSIDGAEEKCMIDFVLVKNILKYMMDV